MSAIFDLIQKVMAITGTGICLIAGVIRLTGSYHIAGIESMTLFIVGMGIMLTAILLKLHLRT